MNAKFEFGNKFTPFSVRILLNKFFHNSTKWKSSKKSFQADIMLQSDEPIINDNVENVDVVLDSAFTVDGFISKEISTKELSDTLLAKVIL